MRRRRVPSRAHTPGAGGFKPFAAGIEVCPSSGVQSNFAVSSTQFMAQASGKCAYTLLAIVRELGGSGWDVGDAGLCFRPGLHPSGTRK